MEQKINQALAEIDELKKALLGDDYGNYGYKHRLEKVEGVVSKVKTRMAIERAIWFGLVAGISIVGNVDKLIGWFK